MKKYMFLVLAAIGLAACTNDDLGGDNGPAHSGEIEESYIAINLSAAGGTRAEGDSYLDGDEAERVVKTAYFFFFDGDGDAFPVNINNTTIDQPGDANGVNYLYANINPTTGSEAPNISDIKNAVLLLKTYEGEYPSQVVAVLNWTPPTKSEENKGYSISELSSVISNIRGVESAFVMSNSVYADGAGANAIIGVPITEDDIFKDETAALNDPVTIHVERIAAKISVSTDGGKTKFELNKEFEGLGSEAPVDVYAQILGWELYNDFSRSYLLKNITPGWTYQNIGFNWNDPGFFRSYWATSIPMAEIIADKNTYKMSYTQDEQTANGFFNEYGFTFSDYTEALKGNYTNKAYTYVGENTNYEVGNAKNPCTKIILKARLVDENDSPVEIARWYATEYAGKDNLLKAVANTIKYTFYFANADGTYSSIRPEDLMVVKGDGEIAPLTHVYFQLSTEDNVGDAKAWYIKDSNGDPQSVEDSYVNGELAKIEEALLYESGETFYFIDIKHLPVGDATDKQGEYGIVRNHIYNVKINSIGGYGSPVYIGNSNLVEPGYPIDPTDNGSFVSAEVRILSWRLVNQEVTIQPN